MTKKGKEKFPSDCLPRAGDRGVVEDEKKEEKVGNWYYWAKDCRRDNSIERGLREVGRLVEGCRKGRRKGRKRWMLGILRVEWKVDRVAVGMQREVEGGNNSGRRFEMVGRRYRFPLNSGGYDSKLGYDQR